MLFEIRCLQHYFALLSFQISTLLTRASGTLAVLLYTLMQLRDVKASISSSNRAPRLTSMCSHYAQRPVALFHMLLSFAGVCAFGFASYSSPAAEHIDVFKITCAC